MADAQLFGVAEERSGHCAVVDGNRLYVWGGYVVREGPGAPEGPAWPGLAWPGAGAPGERTHGRTPSAQGSVRRCCRRSSPGARLKGARVPAVVPPLRISAAGRIPQFDPPHRLQRTGRRLLASLLGVPRILLSWFQISKSLKPLDIN